MDIKAVVLDFVPTLFTVIACIVLYYLIKFILNRQARGNTDSTMVRSIILFLFVMVAFITVILALPLGNELRGQVTSLIGIVISAVLALSSATFIGNALAGIMLKTIKSFKPGDFIQVNDNFGRVTEMGLFHTEIQSEDRDLITLPNLLIAINPLKVTRSSGTFISAEVSLGYDVHRTEIEKCLLDAAKDCDLKDAFVLITSLGDFSVVYKVQGMLSDVRKIISSKSKLNGLVLDHLHKAKIEIVSPSFMNQRQVGDTIFVPAKLNLEPSKQKTTAEKVENLIFDKAEEAEGIESRKKILEETNQKIVKIQDDIKKASDQTEKEQLTKKLQEKQQVKQKLTEGIEKKLDELSDKK